MKKISVAIFDDNKHFLNAICALLNQTKFSVSGCFENCENLEKKISIANADILLMDIDMPMIDGIEAVQKIRETNKKVKILMQTVFEDDDKIFRAILAGANGYILKSDISEKLINYLEEVNLGGTPMSSIVASKVFKLFQFIAKDSVLNQEIADYQLTIREKEILKFLVDGMSYKQIGHVINVSYETVHSHIKNIYKKLHVASMSEAVSKALKERIV